MRKDWVCNRACVTVRLQGIRRLWTRSSIPDGTKKLFLQRSWLALGLTCIYIQCVSRAFSLREKCPEPKTDQFSSLIAFIKNMWRRTCVSLRLHGVMLNLLDFYLYLLSWMPFKARSQNCEKRLLASSWPSVRMEKLGSHWTDFDTIRYFRMFPKSFEKIQILLKSDNNNGYFKWRCFEIFDDISLNSS
jgi:hypothetical protein